MKNDTNAIPEIIEATVNAIGRLGYDGASMQEIARTAGVSKSLLHYHFKSKDDLVMSAVTTLTNEISREIRQRINSAEPSLQRLVQAADDLYDMLISRRERAGFLTEMYAQANYNPELRKRVKAYQKMQSDLICEIIDSAASDLTNNSLITVSELADIVQTAIQGLSIDAILIKDETKIKRRYAQIVRFIVVALTAGSAGGNRAMLDVQSTYDQRFDAKRIKTPGSSAAPKAVV